MHDPAWPTLPPARIIGRVTGDGEVTITDATWRPDPQPALPDEGGETSSEG